MIIIYSLPKLPQIFLKNPFFRSLIKKKKKKIFFLLIYFFICNECYFLIILERLVDMNAVLQNKLYKLMYLKHYFPGPTSCRDVLLTNWQTRGPGTRSRLSIQLLGVFHDFLRNQHKYELGSLRKTPTEDIPPIFPGPTSGQLNSNLQPTNQPQHSSGYECQLKSREMGGSYRRHVINVLINKKFCSRLKKKLNILTAENFYFKLF